jgi:hypothetical protein
MKQQPDNFFREKLEEFQKTAPAGAWDRIESRLEKKNNAFDGWWKIAASVLMLATITYWFLPVRTKSDVQRLAQSNPQQAESKAVIIEPSQTQISSEPLTDPDSVTHKPVATRKKIIQRKSSTSSLRTDHATSPGEPAKQIAVDVLKNGNENEEKVTATVRAIPDPLLKPETITLTFSTEETDRYLNKNTLAEATSAEKKPSTFKKLLKKANDLKSNQDPFGDLREKKNEILALNFKNEKRGQNK